MPPTAPSSSSSSVAVVPSVPLSQTVAILDCGAQYTKVIDRRVRELNRASVIVPFDTPLTELKHYGAIILSGGPNSVFEPNAPQVDPGLFESGLPILGICYGMQLMAHQCGGQVVGADHKEYGQTLITVDPNTALFHGMAEQQSVLMSHGDHVVALPTGFSILATSPQPAGPAIIAAMGDMTRRLVGVQFHPEVELTVEGQTMLGHFLGDIAQLPAQFTLPHRLDDLVAEIQTQVGARSVVTLVSGGVDSAVTTALLLKALPHEQVFAIHVDTGLMRHQESEQVCQALEHLGLVHLTHLKAESDFLNATTDIDGVTVGPLCQTVDPEHKRRIIGDVFFRLTQQTMASLNLDMDHTLIAQGTLRPDLIESGSVTVSQTAHKIKTHHNDVPLIQAQREKGLIIEPNRDFHKDEVRQLGLMLGLPKSVVYRQPFPGPGLGIRVLCATAPYPLEDALTTQAQVDQLCAPCGLQGTVLPVRSVGVQGDFRSYRHLVALSGPYLQTDIDRMVLLAQQLPNQCRALNRVALVLNPAHTMPNTINTVTPTTLTRPVLDLLRAIDHLVIQTMADAEALTPISQLLTVLVPVDSQNQGRHSIAIRGVMTSDYMTARPARPGHELPWRALTKLDEQIRAQFPIDMVMVDLTGKPPATVEWE